MNTTLSKREKTLLYLLLCFLIVVGGFFLAVSPLLDGYNSAKEQQQEIKMQKNVMARTIEGYADTQKALENAKAALREEQTTFYKNMTNEELNKQLQDVVSKYGLQITGLIMVDTTRQDIPAFVPQSDQSGKAPAVQKALVNTVTMTLNGTGTSVIDMLSSLATEPTLRVTDVKIEADKLGAVQTFTLNMEVYMMDYIA